MRCTELAFSGKTCSKVPLFDDAADLFKPYLPCDEQTLRRVYLKLALQHHPDKQPEAHRREATQLFQAIAAAYEAALNPEDAWQKKDVRRVRTAVAAASELGDVEELRRLLTLLPSSSANEEDETGCRPLMFAAAGGCIEAAELLIEFGADLKATNCLGWSITTFAALADQPEMVKWLVTHGSPVTERELRITAWTGNSKALAVMIELYGGRLDNLFKDSNGKQSCLLHVACEGLFLLKRSPEQHADCVRMLLQRGVPVDCSDTISRWTCIQDYLSRKHWADRWQQSVVHMAILEELCLAGADIVAENAGCESAMSIAAKNGCSKVREVLLSFA